MSAYTVDREHIQYLVDAAMSRRIAQNYGIYWAGKTLRPSDYKDAEAIGQMLWDENYASVCYRYKHDDSGAPAFTYRPRPTEFDPVQVIKACHCLAYQSCEHPGWEASEAKQFIDALQNAAVHALDGYNEAEWGVPAECYGRKGGAA